MTNRDIKYIATVSGVRDITLVCSADYAYWADRLADEKLVPMNVNGRVETWLSAARLKWMSVRFAELSVSIRVGDEGNDVFLVAAFNTSRMFSFCERTLFRTPYQRAVVDVDAASLQSFKLYDADTIAINATHAPAKAPASSSDSWEGRIYLPSNGRAKAKQHYFCAHLSGVTEVFPFNLSHDACAFHPTPNCRVVRHLIDSHCVGLEWRVRKSAIHARSKTYVDK